MTRLNQDQTTLDVGEFVLVLVYAELILSEP